MTSFIEIFIENGKSLAGVDSAIESLMKEKKFLKKEKAALAAFYRYLEHHYPTLLSEKNRCITISRRLNCNEFSKLWNNLLSNRKKEAVSVLDYLSRGRAERRLITLATADEGIFKLYTGKLANEDEMMWLKGALARAYIAPQAGLVQRSFRSDGKMDVEGLLFSKGRCWPIPALVMKKMTETQDDGSLNILPNEEFTTPGLSLPKDNMMLGESRTCYFPTSKGQNLISRVAADYRGTASQGQVPGLAGSCRSCSP